MEGREGGEGKEGRGKGRRGKGEEGKEGRRERGRGRRWRFLSFSYVFTQKGHPVLMPASINDDSSSTSDSMCQGHTKLLLRSSITHHNVHAGHLPVDCSLYGSHLKLCILKLLVRLDQVGNVP